MPDAVSIYQPASDDDDFNERGDRISCFTALPVSAFVILGLLHYKNIFWNYRISIFKFSTFPQINLLNL